MRIFDLRESARSAVFAGAIILTYGLGSQRPPWHKCTSANFPYCSLTMSGVLLHSPGLPFRPTWRRLLRILVATATAHEQGL